MRPRPSSSSRMREIFSAASPIRRSAALSLRRDRSRLARPPAPEGGARQLVAGGARALQAVGRAIDDDLEDAQQRLLGVCGGCAAAVLVRGVERRPAARSGRVSSTRDESTNPTGVSACSPSATTRHQRRRQIEGAVFERQPAARFDLAHLALGRDAQPGRSAARCAISSALGWSRSIQTASLGPGWLWIMDRRSLYLRTRSLIVRGRAAADSETGQRSSRRSWSSSSSSMGSRGPRRPTRAETRPAKRRCALRPRRERVGTLARPRQLKQCPSPQRRIGHRRRKLGLDAGAPGARSSRCRRGEPTGLTLAACWRSPPSSCGGRSCAARPFIRRISAAQYFPRERLLRTTGLTGWNPHEFLGMGLSSDPQTAAYEPVRALARRVGLSDRLGLVLYLGVYLPDRHRRRLGAGPPIRRRNGRCRAGRAGLRLGRRLHRPLSSPLDVRLDGAAPVGGALRRPSRRRPAAADGLAIGALDAWGALGGHPPGRLHDLAVRRRVVGFRTWTTAPPGSRARAASRARHSGSAPASRSSAAFWPGSTGR